MPLACGVGHNSHLKQTCCCCRCSATKAPLAAARHRSSPRRRGGGVKDEDEKLSRVRPVVATAAAIWWRSSSSPGLSTLTYTKIKIKLNLSRKKSAKKKKKEQIKTIRYNKMRVRDLRSPRSSSSLGLLGGASILLLLIPVKLPLPLQRSGRNSPVAATAKTACGVTAY